MVSLTYLGHSAFLIESDKTRLIIDPFLSGNPNAPVSADQINADYVLLTHGHGDHLGDGISIAKRNNALVIAPHELALWCRKQGCKAHNMHIGGAHQFPFGRVKLTIAHHGSGFDPGGKEPFAYMGNPCGFLITTGGKTIYHAGDTGLFLDMQLIGQLNNIDVALLPIGDNFTMGIDDAVVAAEFLKPGLVIPMHYQTFDVIHVDPREFSNKVKAKGIDVLLLKVGATQVLT